MKHEQLFTNKKILFTFLIVILAIVGNSIIFQASDNSEPLKSGRIEPLDINYNYKNFLMRAIVVFAG